MKLRALFQFLAMIALSACGPIVISTATPTLPSSTQLPDLVISSVYLGMQGIPGNPGCVPAYAPFEIRAIIENRGSAAAINVLVVEQSTQHQVQVGTLQPMQSVEVQFPLSSTGSYTVVVDPQNTVVESNESNNVTSYLAPTPTPPAICTPVQATPASTLPSGASTSLSLQGLFYADMNLAKIVKVSSGGTSIQVIDGLTAQISPDGLQDLFERSGDLWLAEPMDNPGVNLTNTPDRYETLPQWWPANPAKIVFNSMGINEGKEKKWTHDISGYVSIINKDGTEYTTLSDTPSYTRPALSPDGKTIAYDILGVPMLYEVGVGMRPFDPAQYGYQATSPSAVFTSPAFSPDGHWLLWWVSDGSSESPRQFSLVMFGLTTNNSGTLHTYTAPAGTLGWLDPPVWSPGGQWIAVQTRGEASLYDLWLLQPDGMVSQRFGMATNPVWSPDGQHLAYVQQPPRTDTNVAASLSIIDVPSWNIQQTSLPAGSIPLAWIPAPQ